jgi:hypothetical protein
MRVALAVHLLLTPDVVGFLVFFDGSGIELRVLRLPGSALLLEISPRPFCFSYFSDRVLCLLSTLASD